MDNSFRPFGAPPSEREAREKRLTATREARETPPQSRFLPATAKTSVHRARTHILSLYNPPASHSFGTLPYTGRAKKVTPSASHSFGTSLKEGGRENCRKTLDGTRPGVLKYPQSNEQSRCGGKSTVFRPAREAPPGLEGRSGRAGNVRLPRPRPGAMSAASRRYRENEEEGNFLEIKWNRASLRLYTMYRGRRIFLFTLFCAGTKKS